MDMDRYILQGYTDKKAYDIDGKEIFPVATLRNKYGMVLHIIVDNHCFVLMSGSEYVGFEPVNYWNIEAKEVMKNLSLDLLRF